MKLLGSKTLTILMLVIGISAFGYAQQEPREEHPEAPREQQAPPAHEAKPQPHAQQAPPAHEAKPQPEPHAQQAPQAHEAKPQPQPHPQPQQHEQPKQHVQSQQQAHPPVKTEEPQHAQHQAHAPQAATQHAQPQPHPEARPAPQAHPPAPTHPPAQQAHRKPEHNQPATQTQSRPAAHPVPPTPEQHRTQQAVWQQHRSRNWQSDHRTWQQRGGYHGYRLPDDRYRTYFGRDHDFRIYGLPFENVGGYPRFRYQGYWFEMLDPWPYDWASDWYDTDPVYIAFMDGGYYLIDPRYPDYPLAVEIIQ